MPSSFPTRDGIRGSSTCCVLGCAIEFTPRYLFGPFRPSLDGTTWVRKHTVWQPDPRARRIAVKAFPQPGARTPSWAAKVSKPGSLRGSHQHLPPRVPREFTETSVSLSQSPLARPAPTRGSLHSAQQTSSCFGRLAGPRIRLRGLTPVGTAVRRLWPRPRISGSPPPSRTPIGQAAEEKRFFCSF